MKPKKRSVGLSFALNGLKEVIKSEKNFQVHLLMIVLVIFTGFVLKVSLSEWLTLTIVIGMVLISEIVNSAIEEMIDYIKPEIHPSAKVIKDMGAGGVLIAVIVSIIVGLIIFSPKVIA